LHPKILRLLKNQLLGFAQFFYYRLNPKKLTKSTNIVCWHKKAPVKGLEIDSDMFFANVLKFFVTYIDNDENIGV